MPRPKRIYGRYCWDCWSLLNGNSHTRFPSRCRKCAQRGILNGTYGKHIWANKVHPRGALGKPSKLKGIKRSKDFCLKASKNNARIWLGKKLSEEHKRKMVETRIRNGSYKHTYEQKKKVSLSLQGNKSPLWKGGISATNKLRRTRAEWRDWRNKVFERDDYICQNYNCYFCNNKRGVKLHPHHIKPINLFPELIYEVENGITYCEDFHLRTGLHKKQVMELMLK